METNQGAISIKIYREFIVKNWTSTNFRAVENYADIN